MKRFLISAAAVAATAATLAGPAMAQNMGKAQLAANLGVDPEQFTLAQLIQLKDAATKMGNDSVVVIDGMRVDAEQWTR